MALTARKKLENLHTIGDTIWFKDKRTGKRMKLGTVTGEVYVFTGRRTYKHFIQRIEYSTDWKNYIRHQYGIREKYGFRTCYWTLNESGKLLRYGQFASQTEQCPFRQLFHKAILKWHFN